MKKSQILAALALAFALGVVAPVAGALNASAIDHTAKSASCAEVAHARTIAADTTYNSYLKLYNDIQKYATGANATATETGVAGAIITAMADVTVVATPAAGSSLATTMTFVNNNNIANYDTYKALYDAIKARSVSDFKTAVAEYNKISGVSPVIANRTWADWAAVLADTNVTTDSGTTWTFQDYADYNALFTAVANANLYTEGMTTLDGDLIGVGVTRADITAANPITANDYKAIVTPLGTPATAVQTKYENYVGNATNSLRAKLVASEACSVTMENNDKNNGTSTVYGLLEGIASALRLTENGTYGDKTDAQIIDMLLGATAPITPTDPVTPEEPGTDDDDNNEGGKGDGATTPDTGVIANSEATATSTASIMAGIATALTAAGVGVVAFRNIRRNKKA